MIVVILLSAALASGCFGGPSLKEKGLTVTLTGHDKAVVGGYADLEADASEDGVTYAFAADAGSIVHTDGPRAVWQAPNQTGVYTIQVTAKKGNKSVVAAHKVEVIEAPAVVSAWKLEDDLIGGKNARLTILNKSDKTINALRVRIVMWNNFGERVDFFSDYVFHGVASDTLLQPNAQRDYVWSLYWATGVSDIRAWVYEAAFTDGSVWRLAD